MTGAISMSLASTRPIPAYEAQKKHRKISGALKKPPRTDRVEVHPGAFQQFTSISRMDASKIKKEAPAGDRNCFEWFHYHGFIMSV
jgi:hypothetical protein